MRNKIIAAITLISCLLPACRKDEPDTQPVVACMEVERETTFINDTVWFTSCAENTTQHQWDMGDGNHAEVRNTSHVYTQPGTYLIEHHVQNEFDDTEYATRELTVHMLQLDSITIYPIIDTLTPAIHLSQDDMANIYLDEPLHVYSDRYVFAPPLRFLLLDKPLYVGYYEHYAMNGVVFWTWYNNWNTTKSIYDELDDEGLSYTYVNDSLQLSAQLHFSLYTP